MICSVGVFNRMLTLGMSLPVATVIALGAGAGLGVMVEVGVYRMLRRRNASSGTFLLASFGLLIILERVATIWLGTMPLYLETHRHVVNRQEILGSYLTTVQWLTIAISFAILIVSAAIYVSELGQRLTAVRQSEFLYDWRIGRSSAFFAGIGAISGALATLGGSLYHLQHRLLIERSAMGYLVPAFVSVLSAEAIGRRRERTLLLPLYAVTAMLLASLSQVVTLVLEPRWKDMILLAVAIVALTSVTADRARHYEEGGAQ
jgi:branched-subunit amino acid ABC-type transport system permease component